MKGKAGLRKLKQMISVVAKSKCTAIIRNTSDAMKARLMVTTLTLLSKKVKAISSKIHDAIGGILNNNKDHSTSSNNINDDDGSEYCSNNNAILLYNKSAAAGIECVNIGYDIANDDSKYPDLTHSLFDEEEEDEIVDLLNETNASVIDMVKNSKENFNLEDEIDEAADMFISKFHERMRLQKLLSFKRYQQMLERSTAATAP